jgi:hypothetical protein
VELLNKQASKERRSNRSEESEEPGKRGGNLVLAALSCIVPVHVVAPKNAGLTSAVTIRQPSRNPAHAVFAASLATNQAYECKLVTIESERIEPRP